MSATNSLNARQLTLLAVRARDLADRVLAGDIQLNLAVDAAYDAAVASGLAAAVGDDVIQLVLAEAFCGAREVSA